MQTASHFLSKRNGIWYVWFKDESDNPQKISTWCRLKRDAQKFLDEFIRGKVEKLECRKVVTLSKFKEEYKQFSGDHHTAKSQKSAISTINVFQKEP